MKNMSSASWTTLVKEILAMYGLPPASSLVNHPRPKAVWKRLVKAAVWGYWEKKLKQEAIVKRSLDYIELDSCRFGHVHPVWQCGSDPIQAYMAAPKAQLLTQRYPLTGLVCWSKNELILPPLQWPT
jgi:hypothetical protein